MQISLQGTVTEIVNENKVRIQYDDGEILCTENMNGIVIDKELSEEEVKNLKKGDILLVKLRCSNAMATGMLVSFIISSKLIYTG